MKGIYRLPSGISGLNTKLLDFQVAIHDLFLFVYTGEIQIDRTSHCSPGAVNSAIFLPQSCKPRDYMYEPLYLTSAFLLKSELQCVKI